MKITNQWLSQKQACGEGVAWFLAQPETDGVEIVKKLMIEQKRDWANWLIVRIMERPQYLAYAVFAAERVLNIFEQAHPEDKRPRMAIEAARRCIADDSDENRKTAYSAAAAAYNF